MPDAKKSPTDAAGQMLKSLLVLARAIDQILQKQSDVSLGNRALPGSHLNVLLLLGHRGTETPSRIARFLGVSKPAVTQIVDAMIAAQLVRRRWGLSDRRVVSLELTTKGRRKFASVRRRQLQIVRVALADADNREKAHRAHVVEEITRSLLKAGKAYEGFCLQCGAHADGSCVLVGGKASCLLRETTPHSSRRDGSMNHRA